MRQRTDAPPAATNVDAVRWTTVHDLLASVVDAINHVQWTVEQVNSRRRVPPPKPFPRPGDGKPRPTLARGMSAATLERINQWTRQLTTPEGR